MKKILLTITSFVVTLLAMAQSPNLMNYQGVARNAVGNVLPSQPIGLRLSILNGSPTGAVVYQETRNVTTNAFGLFNVVVGSPGTISTTGTIAGVNWTAFGAGSGTKYLRVELDVTGGTSYFNVGSTQLVSVPYSLYAAAAAPVGPAGGDLTGTYPNPQIFFPLIKTFNATTLTPANTQLIGMTNSATTGTLGAITGTSASNDGSATAIRGTMSSTSPGGFSSGVSGINNGNGGLGIGVTGTQNGSGWGVYGFTPAGTGVYGNTTSGTGVVGNSTTGIGVNGWSNSNNAGNFFNTNAANTTATVEVSTNGVGMGINSTTTGTGRAGYFEVNNAASTANAIEATTNGTGASWGIRANSSGTNGAGLFVQSNTTNTSNNIQSNQTGLGRAGLFNANNAASTANTLEANVGGAGAAVVGNTTGTGSAAIFNNTNAANAASTVLVDNNNLTATAFGNNSLYARRGATSANTFLYTGVPTGLTGQSSTGIGVQGSSESVFGVAGLTFTGTGVQAVSVSTGIALAAQAAGTAGIAGDFSIANAANLSNVIRATNANATNGQSNSTTGGGNAIFGRKGLGLGTSLTNPAGVYGSSSAANGIGVIGFTLTNIGTFGGAFQTGAGVYGQTFGTGGTAVIANGNSSATSYGLVTIGKVQIQGQGAGVNRVLTSNNVGDATWETLAASGGVSGTGTLNFIPKWTPDGTTIGNSQLFDDGTFVGVGTSTPTATKLHVMQTATGNGAAAFQISNGASTNSVATVTTNGIGSGITVQQTNASNGGRGVDVLQAGVGPGVFATSAGGNAVWGITSSISAAGVIGDNTFGEAVVGRNRGGNGVGAVVGRNDSSGYGVRGFNTKNGIGVLGQTGISGGTGTAGRFENVNAANTNTAVEVATNGLGGGIAVNMPNASNGARGIDVNQAGVGPGVFATSAGGNAVWGITSSISAAGVIGDNTFGEAVVGRNRGGNGVGAVVGRNDSSGYGVRGFNTRNGIGVLGQTGISGGTGTAGRFENVNAANGTDVMIVAGNGTGASMVVSNSNGGATNLAIFRKNSGNVARIADNGQIFANGGFTTGGADVAEYFAGEGEFSSYEPGDVLVISQTSDRKIEKSSAPYSTLVSGVYATKPGITLTEENAVDGDLSKMIPMGVIGVIPTKVCLEGGAIKRGDLLVTSSITGVAMKADLDKVKVGQVIGKALQDFDATTVGKITVLVSVK